ncbi:MAG: AccI family restriction endonuclease [Kiritimatiellaceae bacterium]|nr:AccI family restriction endonuclease [Kiritimatiellaceae bacterium]
MPETFKQAIARLVAATPFGVDPNIQMTGRPPTMASSEFLTNKEQGDWAEQIVFTAINENSSDYRAVKYGRSDTLAAGDSGFEDFYQAYQDELNSIGKRPDLLIFKRSDVGDAILNLADDQTVSRAIAAIEVRSSSFLANRYSQFMETRVTQAVRRCRELKTAILQNRMRDLLQQKSPEILAMIQHSNDETFRELDFRLRSWSSSAELQELTALLRELKDQIKILHKRDYLSITPKVEDLALVNRWIQHFNVRHFYLQVFFDKAYVIPFRSILEIASDPTKEDVVFSVEQDIKNQGKTTIKINVQVGKEILGRIDMPEHKSAMKELDRGRLLFYVTFQNGRGYLDNKVFTTEIVNEP